MGALLPTTALVRPSATSLRRRVRESEEVGIVGLASAWQQCWLTRPTQPETLARRAQSGAANARRHACGELDAARHPFEGVSVKSNVVAHGVGVRTLRLKIATA